MRHLLIATCISIASTTCYSAEIFLQCLMQGGGITYLEASAQSKAAKLILDDSVEDGTISITDHHYLFSFPRTKKRYETRITVNRLSGVLTWEHGQPPFGNDNPKNHTRAGLCTKQEPEKL